MNNAHFFLIINRNKSKKIMEKILVKENIIRQSEAMADIKETIQIINSEFKEALIELGIKKMSLAVLKDCLISTANQVEKNYYKAVENDLSSITTPSIRNSLLLDAQIEFGAFRTKLKKIKPKVKNVEYLTIEDNLCVLTPEDEARLLDSLKIYISDNKEVEAYKRHKAAADALNVFFAGEFPLYWFNLFVCENGEIKVNENTDYSKYMNNGTN